MSLINRNIARKLAMQSASAAPRSGGGASRPSRVASIADVAIEAANRAARQIQMRLTHDLRRLKEIQSVARKIDAKREMLPEYDAWIQGLVQAGKQTQRGIADEVLPTIMIWRIDVGDYRIALELAKHVIGFGIPLPHRYQRSAPALIVEEIANAALKAQLADQPFDMSVLVEVEGMTAKADMHDEIRAKLFKAIGFEIARELDALPEDAPAPLRLATANAALAPLKRAQALHERCGVKDRIKRLEKIIAASAAS